MMTPLLDGALRWVYEGEPPALRSAVETFVEVTATVEPDTPFEHGDWGTGDVADGLRWLAHEFHHHVGDVAGRAG